MPDYLETLSPLQDVVTRLKAQEILCVGHNTLYEALRRGELEAVKGVEVKFMKRDVEQRSRAMESQTPGVNEFGIAKSLFDAAQRGEVSSSI